MKRALLGVAASVLTLAIATPASASLDLFQSYVGTYGLSTDGGGSNDGDYTVNAFVPVGATVTAAYLYQSNFGGLTSPTPVSIDGLAVNFGPQVVNASQTFLGSARADVTSYVASIINGGAGGTYDFDISEGDTFETDGTALVVVYSLASLPTSTVAILDGAASVTGDTTLINFATPLDPNAAGFTADIRLGDGFSCCGQQSTVKVNGITITEVAGNDDDGLGSTDNGQLITVGGNDDPFSPLLPTYDQDHERYDLTPYISTGDTQIKIDTFNLSQDDNIFLLTGIFSGEGKVVVPGLPEPATWAMMLLGAGMIGGALRQRRKVSLRYA